MTRPERERTWDIVAAGRPSCDITFSGLAAWPEIDRDVDASGFGVGAGTSFNTPAAANRLGLRVAYVSAIGNDPFGGLIRDEFEREGLPQDFLISVPRPLPFVSVGMNLDGDRGFVTYIEDEREIDGALERRTLELVASGDVRHVHSYIEGDLEVLADAARATGTSVSFDAYSGAWFDLDRPVASAVGWADILFANQTEAMAMARADDLDGALRRLGDACRLVVVKRGRFGASAVVDGERIDIPTRPLPAVDATGAGDAFNAGFLYGWLRRLDVRTSLVLANICGGQATLGPGGYRSSPAEAELVELASEQGLDLTRSV